MRVFVAVQERDGLRHQAEAFRMAQLAVVGRRQDREPDAERELEREHPREEQPVERRDGRDPHRREPQVLFRIPERGFNGMVISDQFCMTRWSTLVLSWRRGPAPRSVS